MRCKAAGQQASIADLGWLREGSPAVDDAPVAGTELRPLARQPG
jgi:hypothetical protein